MKYFSLLDFPFISLKSSYRYIWKSWDSTELTLILNGASSSDFVQKVNLLLPVKDRKLSQLHVMTSRLNVQVENTEYLIISAMAFVLIFIEVDDV